MQSIISKDGQKYDVAVVKLIRNNNIVINRNEMLSGSVYFMLDYFDLLCCTKLTGKDKVYRKFWNFNDNYTKKDLNYKVACKTLSLYAERGENSSDVFEVMSNQTTLSIAPFLGIIQINYVYYYQEAPDSETALSYCEQEIKKCLQDNGFNENTGLHYKIYRSSTSGDFCLVVKSAVVQDVFKIAILINGLTIKQGDKNYRFNTYTNIGIECPVGEGNAFLKFREETIRDNKKCRFALRFTTNNEFAKYIYEKLENKETFESVVGLFGRYDYLLRLSMEEFAEIYGVLCASKVVGRRDRELNFEYNENVTLIELLCQGIKSRKIKIINERALVPLEEEIFDIKKTLGIEKKEKKESDIEENNGELQAIETRQIFGDHLEKFHEMKNLFFEESRTFTDINRAFGEMISTYVPQGIDNDSYVNWQILISDLRVIFDCAYEWKKTYEKMNDEYARKQKRIHFLQDMRLVIDAVNQYYKFLQNVNMHTWQSPLYEIQTQLDAEKMMIAYREFLYEYFKNYSQRFSDDDEKRPMFYPIVYPDMSIDQACAMVVFQEETRVGYRILICRVPSFEYYGRMFNMIPWILHEASHSIRMIPRYDRNKYLFKRIIGKVFLQTAYKLLNQASNDFGYFKLGNLEKDIAIKIVEALEEEFAQFSYAKESDQNIFKLEFNRFETEMIRFLYYFFSRNIYYMEGKTNIDKIKSVQAKILSFLGELNLLDDEIFVENERRSVVEGVLDCDKSIEALCKLLELIYNKYCENFMDVHPHKKEWKMLLQDVVTLEEKLEEKVKNLEIQGEKKRDYLFKMRELNRLYWAWRKIEDDSSVEEIKSSIWMKCVPDIRKRIAQGFDDCEGFVELYRILNMIFGFEEIIDKNQAIRISKDFDILFREEVQMLVEEEITIYRETCADLYMAAALGLSSFGYCRQIFQTVSDVGIEAEAEEMNSANISRFRVVAAILSGEECNVDLSGNKRYLEIPMEKLWTSGKEYCKKTLMCAKDGILQNIQEKHGQLIEDVEYIYRCLDRNIDEMFEDCVHNDFYKEKLDDSVLGIYLNPEIIDNLVGEESEEECGKIKNAFRNAREELNTRLNTIYRVKYFIATLNLISMDGNIVIDSDEYRYFKEVYEKQKEACRDIRNGRTCEAVSDFYNDPNSAIGKTNESMLEDTLDFIQTYYYKNRFKVMSSISAKGGRKN